MTLKQIILLLVFILLSVYIAFLNPHEVEVYLTQNFSLHMPMVILLLSFILVGALVTLTLNMILRVQSSFQRLQTFFRNRNIAKRNQWCEIQFEKGENAFASGNFERARAVFDKILEEFPNHVGALNYMGKIVRKEGNLDRALTLHLKAIQVAPENVKVLDSLAEDYAEASLPAKEIQTLERISRNEPGSPTVLSRIRDAYIKKDDWKNAAVLQKRIVSLVRDKGEQEKEQQLLGRMLYQNGLMHWEKGQVESAMTEFKKALKSSEKCLPAYITLGDAFLKSGNRKNAIRTWQSGFSFTHSPVCLLKIQQVLHDEKDLKELVKIYQEAIEHSHNSTKNTAVLLLGMLYLEKEETDEAIQTLESVPADKSILHSLLLANAYQQKHDTGQMEKASQSAFNIVKESLVEYTCSKCKTRFKEWASHCPECKSWNSLSPAFQVTS